ncbi:MAG: hypothetical protein CM15mV113_010 [Caudoviricetes sp.]|nr:MAG: hypothetical protein CM15mV113_010 [Caudoviricetes sp.]
MTFKFWDGTTIASGGSLGKNFYKLNKVNLKFNFSSTSESFVNIGLSKGITPSSTSSKILVIAILKFLVVITMEIDFRKTCQDR